MAPAAPSPSSDKLPLAPFGVVALSAVSYWAVVAQGLWILQRRLAAGHGGDGGDGSTEPPGPSASWSQAQDQQAMLWLATHYALECVVLLGGVTCFPGWKTTDCLKHHVPFAAIMYATFLLQMDATYWYVRTACRNGDGHVKRRVRHARVGGPRRTNAAPCPRAVDR